MKQAILENTDTSVLLSIIYASEFGKEPVQVGGIISSFDFIQHAIINYEELKGALCRLSENNYIIESNNLEFLPTKIVITNFNEYKVNNKRMNFMLELNYIRKLINAKEWGKNFDYIKANEKYNYKGLTYEIYKSKLDKYLD